MTGFLTGSNRDGLGGNGHPERRARQLFAAARGKAGPVRRLGVFIVVVALLMQPGLALGDQPVEVVSAAHVARIKDSTSVEGIRDNMLIGYGLVVGLAGTGDKQQTIFSVQTLGNMLQRVGVNMQNHSSAKYCGGVCHRDAAALCTAGVAD
jgi:hypothetical protein